ncbi:MATE family efflux transporter [Thalassovita mediterranea]|jgi:MATE family multidrug resistance protein|uniref:DNA-damage-inducible protein F n=1 Tax=Thalassovita mediterranea TaxID=340021 RepID=A0A0P1GQG4_9RHOB|nr:MATE family efflux transporter [Thalassovita mediterranea]CUH84741.1 DNA-damage-inducible protein F [Thalassovita mediterranea]SIS32470.1 multidrug resistance protein, MATE family [Thalassovita mediterranea]
MVDNTAQPVTQSEVTHKRVLHIAVPIVLSNITVPLLGLVDTGVVGQMGQAAPIGAVGVGAVFLGALYWIFGFLRMGTTGLVGQALGAGRMGEVAALFSRALLVAGFAGLALILLQGPLFWAAFQISPASGEVEGMARAYMQIRVWSAPAAIALYGVTGWLIAQERTRAVFVLQIWMNGVNILLDLWFALGLGWGVEGVAFATFLAEWSGLALGLYLCRDVFANPAWRQAARVFDRAALRHMMVVNTDILLRSLMLQAMFLSFLLVGAGFGDVTLAANQVLMQFLHVIAYGLDGFAFAVEALVAQYFGAGLRGAMRRSIKLTSIWAVTVAIAMTVGFALFGGTIIDTLTTAEVVRDVARVYLPYLVICPLLGLGAYMLDGVFIGATATRDMRNMMAVSLGVYLAAVALLVWGLGLGNHGLWLAMLVAFVVRGGTLASRYPALEARMGLGKP